MAERKPSKPSTCRSFFKRAVSPAASFKSGLDRLKQEFNKKLETLINEFASKDVIDDGSYPVPTSPLRTPTPAAYPETATTLGRTPGGQHDREASGSNHTSNQNSEYFDAMGLGQWDSIQQLQGIQDYAEFKDACLRNRRQYGIGSEQRYEHAQAQGIEHPQYGLSPRSEFSELGSEHPQVGTGHQQKGFEHGFLQGLERPGYLGLEEQLAGSIGNILLNTPTASHASHPSHPGDEYHFLNPIAPVSPVSVHHQHDTPVQENYFSGELNQIWYSQLDDPTGSHATSTAQQQPTPTPPGYGGMSVRTGETADSRESLMDTAGTSTTMSPYILAPVAEKKPSILPRFNKFYVELRRIVQGDEAPFPSERMGRGVRVLGKALWYLLRLRKKVVRVKLATPQRKRSRELLQQCLSSKLRPQCKKRGRVDVDPPQPTTKGVSTQSATESRRYKGVSKRSNGHWGAEVRLSACKAYPKAKVWIGTFSSEREAALASDAGYYHCTTKYKRFNFREFVDQLGDSQYERVLALYSAGRDEEAKTLVKELAAIHAAAFKTALN